MDDSSSSRLCAADEPVAEIVPDSPPRATALKKAVTRQGCWPQVEKVLDTKRVEIERILTDYR